MYNLSNLPKIEWKGKFGDDIHCEYRTNKGVFLGHCENMGDSWYCSVNFYWNSGEKVEVFHTSDADILPLTEPAACLLIQMAIKCYGEKDETL